MITNVGMNVGRGEPYILIYTNDGNAITVASGNKYGDF